MKKSINEIMDALKIYEVTGEITIQYIAYDRIKVFVDGEYYGIWDAEKKTFVD